MMNVKKIWDAKLEILEGIKNRVFKTEAVEKIAEERNKVCMQCDQYDVKGDHCLVPGTQPCCGACGCSLSLKQRSLSSACDQGYWDVVLTDEEDLDHEVLNPENDD